MLQLGCRTRYVRFEWVARRCGGGRLGYVNVATRPGVESLKRWHCAIGESLVDVNVATGALKIEDWMPRAWRSWSPPLERCIKPGFQSSSH